MSTKERVHTIVDRLSEEQLNALLVILGSVDNSDNNDNDVDAVMGILHDAANPDLIPLEEGAWGRAVAERYGNA